MKIGALLARPRPCISFEFFPPKTDAGVANLMATIEALRVLDPAFVSVTYGAGGSSRQRTIDVVTRIKGELGIESMAHVTCVGHSRDDLRLLFRELERAGIENVMALRGDPPKGETTFAMTDGGFRFAKDLIAMLASDFSFCLGAAAYPEKHQEAQTFESDIENAAAKVRAGANFLVTQFFFDNDAYFAYVARLRDVGIEVPVIPGIMPITNYDAIARMTKMSGASVPPRLLSELEARAEEPDAIADLGVAYTALQCQELLSRGAPGLHFYTLNKSTATRAVVSALLATRALTQSTPYETVIVR